MSNSILLDERQITISPSLAEAIGLESAVILSETAAWMHDFTQDGKTLIFKGVIEYAKSFRYIKPSTAINVIRQLERDGLIVIEFKDDRVYVTVPSDANEKLNAILESRK